MIKTFNNGYRLLIAEDGMIMVDKERGTGSFYIYLGVYDSEENYDEMPIDEYVKPELVE